MIVYLLRFILCSGLLLLAYHLLLKNKAIYNFNRGFLLVGIVFSLIVPAISIQQKTAPVFLTTTIYPIRDNGTVNTVNAQPVLRLAPTEAVGNINYIFITCVSIYGVVALVLLFRFGRNLIAIHKMIVRNKKLNYKQAKLVLIHQQLTPHTFLNFIFLNQDDYRQGKIEDEVLQHELTHAAGRHSVDIILIELIQVLCWFNPFIILYRKAMQLNHEFIADAAVLKADKNVNSYQNLLISKLSQLQSLAITSQFNYSITKKRLIMMTKTTSTATAWLSRIVTIPVMAIAFMLFCNQVIAQQDAAPAAKTKRDKEPGKMRSKDNIRRAQFSDRVYPSTKEGISEAEMKEYATIEEKYNIAVDGLQKQKKMTDISDPDKKRLEELFKSMSVAQQHEQTVGFYYSPPPLQPSKPTTAQLKVWQNAKIYGVWIDDKRIKNADLENYKPTDFKQCFVSRLTKIAIKNDKFDTQIGLMTADFYDKYRKDAEANSNKSMIYFRMYRMQGNGKS